MLERVTAEVTAVVAGLIAEDPGARRGDDDEATREHRIQVLAQMLVGCGSVARQLVGGPPATCRASGSSR